MRPWYAGKTRRLIISLLCASIIAFSFEINVRFPADGILGWLEILIACLSMPGLLVSIVVAGNVHLGKLWVAYLANGVFYFGLIYFVLGRMGARVESTNRSAR
jgi:hypothetical protein